MKITDMKVNETEIIIYQSLWKTTLLSVLCMSFAVMGCIVIMDDDCSVAMRILAGWLNVIFFGACGLSVFMVTVYNRIRHIPLLIIHEDKLEFYVQVKGAYYTIKFADVKGFRMTSVFSTKQIAIDYKTTPLINRCEEASSFKRRVLALNFNVLGAIESIPAEGLTMKGRKICNILNERLEKL